MAADAWAVVAAVDDEVVAFGLEPDGAVDRFAQQFIADRGAQRLAQVGGVFVTEAGVQGAGAGDADAVAGFAEIMRHRSNEAERAAGLGDADVARRAAGGLG